MHVCTRGKEKGGISVFWVLPGLCRGFPPVCAFLADTTIHHHCVSLPRVDTTQRYRTTPADAIHVSLPRFDTAPHAPHSTSLLCVALQSAAVGARRTKVLSRGAPATRPPEDVPLLVRQGGVPAARHDQRLQHAARVSGATTRMDLLVEEREIINLIRLG